MAERNSAAIDRSSSSDLAGRCSALLQDNAIDAVSRSTANADVAQTVSTLDTHAADTATTQSTPVALAPRVRNPRNPFDPRVSDRDPFPSFAATMATAANDSESESDTSAAGLDASRTANLDWSIDTIAEMKPMAFSPLPEQLQHSANDTDDSREFTPSTAAKRAQFFHDEAQYSVLQTPSPQLQQQQTAATNTPQRVSQRTGCRDEPLAALYSPSRSHQASPAPSASQASRRTGTSPLDLHSRCQDAIALFQDRLRERQRKLSRLQLPQPHASSRSKSATATPPSGRASSNTNKSSHKRRHPSACEFPWKASSASELKGIHPRASSAKRESPAPAFVETAASPFSVLLTPIAPRRAAARSSATAPTARRNGQESELSFSFTGGSPLSPIAPFHVANRQQSSHRPSAVDSSASTLSPIPRRVSRGTDELCGVDTPSFDSPPAPSASASNSHEHDKENSGRQQHSSTGVRSSAAVWSGAAADALSLKTLAMLQQSATTMAPRPTSITTITSATATTTGACTAPTMPPSPSIAQRQVSFMAAIEAEATARESASQSPHS